MVKIYGIICPIIGEVRYIGKTDQDLRRRLTNHLSDARKNAENHRQRWIRKCLNIGLLPSIFLLEEVPAGQCWQEREIAWIARAIELGYRLTNQTTGGEGVQLSDPETLARWKINLSAAMERVRARPGYMQCRKDSSKKGWESSRHIMLAAFANPETKAKHSKRAKRTWENPETRGRMMNRWTPEARAKQAELVRSPERLAKTKAAMTPEVRAKQAATLKATWAKRKAAK